MPLSFADALAAVIRREIDGATGIERLRALSGGAVQETWAFEAQTPVGAVPLILRRARPALRRDRKRGVALAEEAQLLRMASASGIPVPPVRAVLRPADEAGEGFIMDFVPGETIARKILRDAEFAAIRPKLARQCGEILARIHATDTEPLTFLDVVTPEDFLVENFRLYDQSGHLSPVFELAFRWLYDHVPPPPARAALVHGDFRNGNLIIGAEGVRAVLDWEFVHLGDPMMDLGYICVNSWRFGEIDKPVGGFGERETLYAGYESAGGRLDRERAAFWELACTLRWGMNCLMMGRQFITGIDRSVERGAIGRRMSETEIDLLRLLAPRD
jgi:aminoglycoside phosphotransferase (APT) family kinase protein